MIDVNSKKILMVLIAVGIFLIVASTVGQLAYYKLNLSSPIAFLIIEKLFLGFETNFPTYYVSFLCLVSAFLPLIIYFLNRGSGKAFYWLFLSGGFFYISIDEIIQIHEWFIGPIANLLGRGALGIFTFAWVIPGMIIVLLLALFFWKFLLLLDKATRFTFLLAALIYIGGAIGLELIGGYYYALHGADNLIYRMMQTIEESLEMAGLIIFIWGLLIFITNRFNSVLINFKSSSKGN